MTPPGRRRPLPSWPLAVAAVAGLTGCVPLAWHAPGAVILPWRLFAGVLLAEVVVVRRVRRLPRRRVLLTGLLLLAATAATFLLRQVLAPAAFFHQNGQGPEWAQVVLCGSGIPYGPGYAEVLGWVPALAGAAPEHALFLVQALAAATLPASAWVLLRALRVRPALAWLAFGALAAAPSLARVGQSESYYTLCAVLLFAAAAVLAVGASGRRRLDLWLGVVAAGLLVAQAARVHPVGWMAAAVLPAVLAVGRGRRRRRLARVALAGVGIGAVVAVTTGPALLAVLTGDLGHQWLGASQLALPFSGPWWVHLWFQISVVVPLVGAVAVVGRGAEGVLRAFVLAAVVFVMIGADRIGNVLPPVAAAHLSMWLPVLLAVVGVALSALVRRRRATVLLAATLGVLVLLADLRMAKVMFRLPTDVLEAKAVATWRALLPRDATVFYLSNAPPRVLDLPVYRCGVGGALATRLLLDAPRPASMEVPSDAWYIRDSLCSTPEGRAECRRLEDTFRASGRRLVERRTLRLPARESMVGMEYPSRTVDLTLFEIRPPRPQAKGSSR